MQLVMEPATRRRLAENARRSAQAYDIHLTARRVLDEYERLAAQTTQHNRRWVDLRQRLRKLLPLP
jgi:hypothetical protein